MPARKIDQPHSSTKEYQRAYYLKYKDRKRMFTPEQIERKRVTRRQHYIRNKERYLEQAKQRRGQPGYEQYMAPFRRKSLLARYGITHEDYLAMLERQNGKCAICGATETTCSRSRYFDVDHNHQTGQVRGLLCRDCNLTVGMVESKQYKLGLIRQYLAEWNAVEFDPKDKPVSAEDR